MQGMGAVCSTCGDVTALIRHALSSKEQKTPTCRGLNLKRCVVMQGGVQRQVPPPIHCSLRNLALVPMPVVSDITFQFKTESGSVPGLTSRGPQKTLPTFHWQVTVLWLTPAARAYAGHWRHGGELGWALSSD